MNRIGYDSPGRVAAVQHPAHKEKITYYQNGESATNIVASVRSGRNSVKYNYDASGNISGISENGKLAAKTVLL